MFNPTQLIGRKSKSQSSYDKVSWPVGVKNYFFVRIDMILLHLCNKIFVVLYMRKTFL